MRWTTDVLLYGSLIFLILSWQTRNHLGGMAPAFALPSRSGEVVTLEGLKGKPTMLVFWAPWCSVCKAESTNVDWTMSLAGERANVVSIATAFNDPAQVEAYVRDQGVDYPVLLDEEGLVSTWKVDAFPTIYFLDAQGRIKRSVTGYTTTVGMLWRLLL